MAKQSVSKSGTTKVRFIMLEAEGAEGDLAQIASAIQSALKPSTTIIQQRLPASLQNTLPVGDPEEMSLDHDVDVADVDDDLDNSNAPSPRASRDVKLRKPITMKVLDLDLNSDTSLESYVSSHTPKNDTERNLVALAWFKEHRPDEDVTANHVYTCYRAMKWPSGIDDFSGTLRSLKKQQLVTSPGRGQFSINHLGIARVERLSSGT